MAPDPSEARGLAGIRRRRWWLSLWVASALLALPVWKIAPDRLEDFGIAWAAVGLVLNAWHTLSRCPRCHGHFNWNARRRVKFVRACVNCGLPLRPWEQ